MPYLLDTNALSEADKPRPDPGFMDWFDQVATTDLYISCIALGEIYKGIELLKSVSKRNLLSKRTAAVIEGFSSRILIIDLDTTLLWAKLMAGSVKKGQTAPSIDALIAAQSLQHNLVLVTRNINDFQQFNGLEVFCPWSE